MHVLTIHLIKVKIRSKSNQFLDINRISFPCFFFRVSLASLAVVQWLLYFLCFKVRKLNSEKNKFCRILVDFNNIFARLFFSKNWSFFGKWQIANGAQIWRILGHKFGCKVLEEIVGEIEWWFFFAKSPCTGVFSPSEKV
jgi:hypothetical protein